MENPSPAIDPRILNPAPGFKLWSPKEGQCEFLEDKMLTIPLHLSDERRTQPTAKAIIFQMFKDGIPYEIGDFCGIIHIGQIVPEHKAVVSLFFWGEIWTPKKARNAIVFFDTVMDVFKLVRLSSQTADPRVEKMAKICGFKREGSMRKAFKWQGEYKDLTMLGRVKVDTAPAKEA